MSVGLTMLVRDEADIIERCLTSVRPHIDTWTIFDTGSTDDTVDRIEAVIGDIPGNLHADQPFVNSAETTSKLLRFAKDSADWLLLLHGDMTIECWELPAEITGAPEGVPYWRCADAYLVPERNGDLLLSTVKLVRGDWDWSYEGRCHEHIETTRPYSRGNAPGILIHHHRDRKSKTTNDGILAALQADLAEKPGDSRTLFYIAQTLAEMGRWDEAIDHYRMRLAVGGWDEETFYARYRLGCLLAEHRSYSDGARELLAAWEMRPSRVEPLRALAHAATHIADRTPLPDDTLFLHTDAYREHVCEEGCMDWAAHPCGPPGPRGATGVAA